MFKAITPTITMTFPAEMDFDEVAHICFTMKQGSKVVLEKHDSQLTIADNVVSVWLSQAETLALSPGEATFQLNWTYPPDGNNRVARGCSDVHVIVIKDNLKNEVIA